MSKPGETREQLLVILGKRGSSRVKALALVLDIGQAAARHHLEILVAEGKVVCELERAHKVGRPSHLFSVKEQRDA